MVIFGVSGAGEGGIGLGMTGAGAGASVGIMGAGGGVVNGAILEASDVEACSGDKTGMIPEHCLHLIFLPMRVCETFVCHWQAGQMTEMLAPLEASGTWPRTMGAAAFLGVLTGEEAVG